MSTSIIDDPNDEVLLLDSSGGEIPRKKRTCGSFITPLIVLILIGYGVGVYFYTVIAHRWIEYPVVMFFLSLGMLLLLFLTLMSFYRVIFTDPGTPPSPEYWLHLPYYSGREVETGNEESDPNNRRVLHNRIRHCKHCKRPKPDRTHHCRVTGQCVLRMDHFCPWVNNTVGFLNHKFFILFCFWCAILCFYACVTIAITITLRTTWVFTTWNAGDVQAVVVLFYCGIFTLTLTSFVGLHLSLLRKNQTTLENMSDDSRWDKGVPGLNVEEIFGTARLTWLLPVDPIGLGSGLEFGKNALLN